MFELFGVGAVALTMALVEVTKKIGVPKRVSPVIALIIGLALGFIGFGFTSQGLIMGLATGTSAVGVYSGTKNVRQKVKEDE